jgi:simple sugar transport system ATP-binding protein
MPHERGGSSPPLLSLEQVSVEFPGVLACDRVFLDLRQGEIHALVGENGAGKSTLMHCAAGVVRPTGGTIRLDGRPVRFSSPQEAQAAGIAMVFQNFLLVERLSVLDNVVLGSTTLPPLLDRKRLEAGVEPICERLGIRLDWSQPVESLSAGEKQKVALVRALYRRARVLILDEPTAVLTPDEAARLLESMRRLASDGVAILFVSHKLPEIKAVADRITVMHRGRCVAQGVSARDTSSEQIAQMMVGPSYTSYSPHPPPPPPALAHHLLELDSISLHADGRSLLSDVSLALAAGEILGIAGVSGNGQKELVSVCSGMTVPSSGRVLVRNLDLTGKSARAFFEAGLSYVSEDRYHEASAAQLSLSDSLCLKGYRTLKGRLPGTINPAAMVERARTILDSFRVRHSGAETLAASLSGGNLQKLILGRELSHAPAVLVVHQPTQGLDLASTEFVYDLLLEQASRGTAVLLASSDLDEVLRLSHRLVVMYRGRIAGEFPRVDFDRARIGALMAGLTTPAQAGHDPGGSLEGNPTARPGGRA